MLRDMGGKIYQIKFLSNGIILNQMKNKESIPLII